MCGVFLVVNVTYMCMEFPTWSQLEAVHSHSCTEPYPPQQHMVRLGEEGRGGEGRGGRDGEGRGGEQRRHR